MANYTVLDIIQKTLAVCNLEPVTDVDESVEADQIFELLKTAYDELLDDIDWDYLQTNGQLELNSFEFRQKTLGVDADTVEMFKLPDNALQVNWIKYDTNDLIYITPKEMTDLLDSRDQTLSTVDAIGAVNNADSPTRWTTYDDIHIVVDQYDGSLAANKTDCLFITKPAVLGVAGDVPSIPERMMPVLLNMTIAEAFATINGDIVMDRRYRKKARNQLAKIKRWASRINKKDSTYSQDYGRKRASRVSNEIPSHCVIEGTP
jgi:hypothetical protein